MSTTMLKSLLATLALESQEEPKTIAEEAVADVAAEKVAEAEKAATAAAAAPTDTPPTETVPTEEPAVTEEEVEKVEDVTQALESLCLMMESAVKSGKGYSRLELALHDTAVVGHCKRLKIEPPLRPSLESVAAQGAEAETQLVLASLESYVEKLQDVALEASGSFVLSLSQEGFGTTLAEGIKKLFAYIKAYATKVYNWFASRLMKKHSREKVDKYNAIFAREGLSVTATPEQMAAAIKKSVGNSGYLDEIKTILTGLLESASKDMLNLDESSTFRSVAEKLQQLSDTYARIGHDEFVLKYCHGNNRFTAGRIADQFVSARFVFNRLAHAVSMAAKAVNATDGEAHRELFDYVSFTRQRNELLALVKQEVAVVKQAVDNHNSQSYDENEELLLSQMDLAEKIQKFIKSFEGRRNTPVKSLGDYVELRDKLYDIGSDLAGALQTIGDLRVKEDSSYGPGAERKSFQLVNYALNGIRESIAIVQRSARSVDAYIEHLSPIAEILEKLEKGV